jgi:hypothetical protein
LPALVDGVDEAAADDDPAALELVSNGSKPVLLPAAPEASPELPGADALLALVEDPDAAVEVVDWVAKIWPINPVSSVSKS